MSLPSLFSPPPRIRSEAAREDDVMSIVSKGGVVAARRVAGVYVCAIAAFVAPWSLGCGGRVEPDDDVAPPSLDAGDFDAPAARDDAAGPIADASRPDARADASVDAPPPDAAAVDVHAPFDSAAPDSASEAAAPPAPPCAQARPPALLGWRPPTPFHQGACTDDEIATYTSCLGASGCTSASAPCDACLETNASADAYGPIILGTMSEDGFGDAFVNWGGCQANVDGHTQAGSCGSETNAWQACASEVCPYATCGAGLDACDDYAYESACVGHTESDACASEWGDSNGVGRCASFTTLATLWCGP